MIIILTKVVKHHYIQQGKNIRHKIEEDRKIFQGVIIWGVKASQDDLAFLVLPTVKYGYTGSRQSRRRCLNTAVDTLVVPGESSAQRI